MRHHWTNSSGQWLEHLLDWQGPQCGQDVAPGASRKEWPLQKGFDRFYGFLGGETNQWYPDLVEDNRFIEAPYTPEEGYHLSKDMADKAIGMIYDSHPFQVFHAKHGGANV